MHAILAGPDVHPAWALPVCRQCDAPAQNLPVRADVDGFELPRVGSLLCLRCGCRTFFRKSDWVFVEWSRATGGFVASPRAASGTP